MTEFIRPVLSLVFHDLCRGKCELTESSDNSLDGSYLKYWKYSIVRSAVDRFTTQVIATKLKHRC